MSFAGAWSALPLLVKQKWRDYRGSPSNPTGHEYEMLNPSLLSAPTDTSKAGSIASGRSGFTSSARSDTAPLLQSSNSAAYADENDNHNDGEKPSIPGLIHGWRVGVTICATTASVVFLINTSLTIWAGIKYGVRGGIGTIQNGNCAETRSLSLWLHVMINALSTFLLSASNYTMQCLSSPTRDEVDRAHKKNIRLDIGVPGMRNLRQISWNRIVLWWLLALSGIPLHLLYNSAIFSTLFVQDHTVYAVSADLIMQDPSNWPAPDMSMASASPYQAEHFKNASNWDLLENDKCIKSYSRRIVSDRGDVLTITNGSKVLKAISGTYDSSGYCSDCDSPYTWICYDYQNDRNNHIKGMDYAAIWCDPNTMLKRDQDRNWTISSRVNGTENYPIQHCLSQPIEERCKLQFSLIIMAIVIGCNFMKSLCMFLALWHQRMQPLVTIGDAIESFLRRPDPTTMGMCLASKKYFYTQDWKEKPMKWNSTAYRWSAVPSMRRWATCNLLFVLSLLCIFILSFNAHIFTKWSAKEMWKVGYGGITSDAVLPLDLPGSAGLIFTVLLANLPQGLLSFLFLTYNGLITCMLLADEWSGYAHERKPLRVTNRTGHQRSTYRLQIPYKYGIPMFTLSALVHWLISQSLFLARVDTFDANGDRDNQNSFSSVGYSPIAIITVLVVGTLLVIFAYSVGFRRFKPGLTLAGPCSAAISAACHRPSDDVDAANKPVKWGVIKTDGDVGHCCFTSYEVLLPNPNRLYAGLTKRCKR